MYRVGVSFKSELSPDEIHERYVRPLREAVEASHAGIYSNYLRQADVESDAPAEHLLMFIMCEFQAGLHLLRMSLEEIGPPPGVMFHNLEPSDPMY